MPDPLPACLPPPLQDLELQTKKLMVALAEANFYGAVGVVRKALQNADDPGGCQSASPCVRAPFLAAACAPAVRRRDFFSHDRPLLHLPPVCLRRDNPTASTPRRPLPPH